MARDIELLVGAWDPNGAASSLRLLEICDGRAELREVSAPSSALAIATDPSGEIIYTAEAGGVAAWRRTADGLTPLGERYASPDTLPCHLAVVGAHLVVAHYSGGQVTVHPLAADGALEPPSDVVQLSGSGLNPERQARPHMVWCGADGEVIVADLGVDLLRPFRLVDGRLVPTSQIPVPPGTGPRHLVVVDGIAYVAGEHGDTLVAVRLSTGEVLHVEPCGSLSLDREMPSHPSAIKVSADGRHCYVLRRGPNTVATFRLEPEPRLIAETPCGGDWPWDLVVAGDRLYIANQRSGTVSVLRVDALSGVPSTAEETVPVPAAVSLLLIEERDHPHD